jgi:hypothetical protein
MAAEATMAEGTTADEAAVEAAEADAEAGAMAAGEVECGTCGLCFQRARSLTWHKKYAMCGPVSLGELSDTAISETPIWEFAAHVQPLDDATAARVRKRQAKLKGAASYRGRRGAARRREALVN